MYFSASVYLILLLVSTRLLPVEAALKHKSTSTCDINKDLSQGWGSARSEFWVTRSSISLSRPDCQRSDPNGGRLYDQGTGDCTDVHGALETEERRTPL